MDVGIGPFGIKAAEAIGIAHDDLASVEPCGRGLPWRSRLRVADLAIDSVELASVAMNLVTRARRPQEPPAAVRVSPRRVAASFTSERLFRINEQPPSIWSPLSGFWPAADGWVRTHANYPHHEARLRRVLGVGQGADRGAVATAIAARAALELEDSATSAGAVVAAVRDVPTWRAHPQAMAIAGTPLIYCTRGPQGAPRAWPARGPAPLSGLKVLDLTTVIAGPVATRDLAYAGADVLRVDSPNREEAAWQHLDTGQGKRSTLLDLHRRSDRAALDELLGSADVLVTGYRPGALDRLGLAETSLATRFPGLVTAQVSAWGTTGPWSQRRGFDSIVQAAIGIAAVEGAMESEGSAGAPGALPAQALDHSAGHFLAAAIATALLRQRTVGGTPHVAVSLARIGQELLAAGTGREALRERVPAELALPTTSATVRGQDGESFTITCAPPVLAHHNAPGNYAWVGRAWGADRPSWLE